MLVELMEVAMTLRGGPVGAENKGGSMHIFILTILYSVFQLYLPSSGVVIDTTLLNGPTPIIVTAATSTE